MSLLRTVGWLVCVVYATIPMFWLMIHPRAERLRQQTRSPYRVLLVMWIGSWIVSGAVTKTWRHSAFYTTWWMWIPAVLLLLAGIRLYRVAGLHFSLSQLIGLPEIRRGNDAQELVTTGIRARVRHPIYLGHLCEMIGWSLGTGLIVCWALTAFAVITGAFMIHVEDAELAKRFGAVYDAYRARVPPLIPRW